MLVNGKFVKDWDKERIGIAYQLDAIRRMQQDSLRYRWLCLEFAAGRERDITEGLNNKEELDDYIDRKINEEFGPAVH